MLNAYFSQFGAILEVTVRENDTLIKFDTLDSSSNAVKADYSSTEFSMITIWFSPPEDPAPAVECTTDGKNKTYESEEAKEHRLQQEWKRDLKQKRKDKEYHLNETIKWLIRSITHSKS